MEQLLFGLALMLQISQISTSSSTPASIANSTGSPSESTSSTAEVTTAPTTAAGSAAPVSNPQTTTPTPAKTTFVPYTCKSGECEGNETCINSTKTNMCNITTDEQGCFRKQNSTHSEVGCRLNCDTSTNTAEDWCCKGPSDCIFGSMPTRTGNNNENNSVRGVSRNFALVGTMALVLFVM